MTKISTSAYLMIFAFVAAAAIALPFATNANAISSASSLISNTAGNAVVVSDSSSSGNGSASVNVNSNSSIGSGSVFQSICSGVSVSDNEVFQGDSVTFTWNTSQFNSLTINGKQVSGGSYTMNINQLGQNIIQVAGFDKDLKPCAKQIIIVCNPVPVAPVCKSFSASPATITNGGNATLNWSTEGASRVSINNGIGNVSANGSKTVSPTQTTTYTLTVYGAGDTVKDTCATKVTVQDTPAPSCDMFTASPSTITLGNSATLTWETTNATAVSINNGIGSVPADGSRVVSPTTNTTYTLTVSGAQNQHVDCTVTVKVVEDPITPACLTFTASPATINAGESATLNWTTQNASRVAINNAIGNVGPNGAQTVSPLVTTTYTLSVFDGNDVLKDTCATTVTIKDVPAPSCDSFTASPSTIVRGNSSTLTWETSNANTVLLNNGIGAVPVDGSRVVTPTTNTTYTLTVIGAQDQAVDCAVEVKVSDDPVPVCKSFTASPSSLGVGGGSVTLNWDVEDASEVKISPTVGTVGLNGSTSVNVTQSTTFTLTAKDTNGDETTCAAPVAVADPAVFTCAANVSFSATDTSIRRGNDTTLNWNVTGADSVSITDLGTVSLTGSQTVSPNSDRTYTLTATQGSETINCPVSIDVSSGGGGGGSSTPRCDLDISDTRIERGEEITLRWDTSRARDLEIVDDRGNVLVTTEDLLSSDKDDLFDGRITLRPTRDTEYTLTVERGSRDRTCRVSVDVEDGQVLGVVRDQQPLVAGIALSQVPYTGFEAGPVLTLTFYLLLMAWALYVAYFIVVRNQNKEVAASHFASTADLKVLPGGATNDGNEKMKQAEATRPDAFAASAATETATDAPANLPTGGKTIGYESYFGSTEVTETQADQIVTDLENRAHSQKALLSSDAIAHFLTTTEGAVDRNEELDRVIADAKSDYPLEDGWIVINQTRMEQLVDTAPKQSPKLGESLPTGSGSLAEAIVTGNVVAAYEMIGNRPMFALAEAAADLDSVVRARKGDTSPISDLLLEETKDLSDEQLQTMIKSLTGAIDGTYTDEASAVKMAIMKAVKEIA